MPAETDDAPEAISDRMGLDGRKSAGGAMLMISKNRTN